MKTKEKNVLPKIYQFKHRRRTLLMIRSLLIFLQSIALSICCLYVLSNYMRWELLDLKFGMHYISLLLESKYINYLCFVLSVILFFPRPEGLKVPIAKLSCAIKYLETATKIPFYEDAIKDAEMYITDVDKVYQKKKMGEKEKIEPHEKRMVLRRNLIVFGIIGICILTLILIAVFGWNVPQVAAIDLLIGYFMVIYEAHYYQIQLRKAGIQVMSEQHKEIISKKKDKRQLFVFCKKVCHLRADRYSNYNLVLQVATSATNVVAILITIIDTIGDTDLQRLFALEINNINDFVAMIFMFASITLFIVDAFFEKFLILKIVELKGYEYMDYSEANYIFLIKNIYDEMIGKNIFSQKALDVGRASYEYSIDALVNTHMRETRVTIPSSCMLTVKDIFSGKIPRYRLTALILWLCGFCGFVWGKTDISNILPITIFSISVYYILVLVNAVRVWSKKQEWILFETDIIGHEKLNRSGNVKGDFLVFFLRGSFIVFLLVTINIFVSHSNIMGTNLLYCLGIAIIMIFTMILELIGFILIHKRVIIEGFEINCFSSIIILLLFCLGYAVVSHLFCQVNTSNLIFMNIVVLMLVQIFSVYCRRIWESANYIKISFGDAIIITNWCNALMLLLWSINLQSSGIESVLILSYAICIVLLAGYICWNALKKIYLEKRV